MGIGQESPLTRLTPARAVLIMGVIVGALALIVVFAGGGGLLSTEGYADDVRALSTSLRLEDQELVPQELRNACLAGDAGSCAQHRANVSDQAERVEDHIADLFGFNVPSEAANLNADYTLVLQDLEKGYRAEANALGHDNLEALALAAGRRQRCWSVEAALVDQLNRDFPSAPAPASTA